MKWYEKAWVWVKKYWGVVVGAVAFVVGVVLGRKSVSGVVADYERLRGSLRELQEELGRLRDETEQLRELKHDSDRELQRLGEELAPSCAPLRG